MKIFFIFVGGGAGWCFSPAIKFLQKPFRVQDMEGMNIKPNIISVTSAIEVCAKSNPRLEVLGSFAS